MASYGGAPKCPKCTKSVYAAEEVRCGGMSFHKMCFACTTCNKSLDTKTVSEHESKIYCRGCYTKQFGPKGYGYGVGAGALAHTGGDDAAPVAVTSSAPSRPSPGSAPAPSSASGAAAATSGAGAGAGAISAKGYTPVVPKMQIGGGDTCGRCSKAVYSAEKVIGAGRTWHKTCFTCTACKRGLDSSNVQDKDAQLYCTPCYKKQFGPKGFRGGVAGGMEHTE